VEKSNGTIYWYGVGGDVLDETDLSGNLKNEYVFFDGHRIAQRNSSGTVYYYVADHLGSAREMVEAGQTSACYDADFLPYGQEVDFTDTCGSNYKFEGKERDTETDNDNFGARYYRSLVGRWLSPDWSAIPAPVPYANLTNPQTLNLYAMTSDDPETFADLDGHATDGASATPEPSSSAAAIAVKYDCGDGSGDPQYIDPMCALNVDSYVGNTQEQTQANEANNEATQQGSTPPPKKAQQQNAAGMNAETAAVNLTRESIRNGHPAEYGGDITKTNGKISFTKPIRGRNGSFNPSQVHVPKGATVVGVYHTHPESSAKEAEGPSVGDINYLRAPGRTGWVGYVVGSYSGVVYRYTGSEPVKGPFDTAIYGTRIGVVPCPASNGGTCQ